MKHRERNGCKKQTTSKNRIIKVKVTYSIAGVQQLRHIHMFHQVLQQKITAWKSRGFGYRALFQAREVALMKALK